MCWWVDEETLLVHPTDVCQGLLEPCSQDHSFWQIETDDLVPLPTWSSIAHYQQNAKNHSYTSDPILSLILSPPTLVNFFISTVVSNAATTIHKPESSSPFGFFAFRNRFLVGSPRDASTKRITSSTVLAASCWTVSCLSFPLHRLTWTMPISSRTANIFASLSFWAFSTSPFTGTRFIAAAAFSFWRWVVSFL